MTRFRSPHPTLTGVPPVPPYSDPTPTPTTPPVPTPAARLSPAQRQWLLRLAAAVIGGLLARYLPGVPVAPPEQPAAVAPK